MPVRVYACLNAVCTVMFFRTKDGRCRRCGQLGEPVNWTLRDT